jgi:hypothetical protein
VHAEGGAIVVSDASARGEEQSLANERERADARQPL